MLVDFERLNEADREELAERGRVHGLTGQQVFACDRLAMDPRTYARFAGVGKMTISDYVSIREEQRVEQQGRADAVREQAKERALRGTA